MTSINNGFRAMSDHKVFKHNAIIEASYRPSLAEQRILLACIAQVKRTPDTQVTDEVLYRVSIADFQQLTGLNKQASWKQLKSAEKSLWDRYITIPYTKNGHHREKRFRWIQEIDYAEQEGFIELRFSKAILPYLSDLTERFTSYMLSDIANMTSAYGIRLFELLIQWERAGQREIEIDWLRHTFQLEDKYEKFSDLKKRVIIPAVEQINLHSPLSVTWTQKKTGRKISHLIFSFSRKDNLKRKNKKDDLFIDTFDIPEKKSAKANRPRHIKNTAENAINQIKMNLK